MVTGQQCQQCQQWQWPAVASAVVRKAGRAPVWHQSRRQLYISCKIKKSLFTIFLTPHQQHQLNGKALARSRTTLGNTWLPTQSRKVMVHGMHRGDGGTYDAQCGVLLRPAGTTTESISTVSVKHLPSRWWENTSLYRSDAPRLRACHAASMLVGSSTLISMVVNAVLTGRRTVTQSAAKVRLWFGVVCECFCLCYVGSWHERQFQLLFDFQNCGFAVPC